VDSKKVKLEKYNGRWKLFYSYLIF